jgi:hypothetical protein
LVKVLSQRSSQIEIDRQYIFKIQDPRWARGLRREFSVISDWDLHRACALIDGLQKRLSKSPLDWKIATLENLLHKNDKEWLLAQKEIFLQELGLLSVCYAVHDNEKNALCALRSAGVRFIPHLVASFRTKAWLPQPLLPSKIDPRLLQYPAILMEYFPGQTLSSATESYILTSRCKSGSISTDHQQSAVEEVSEALLEVIHHLTDLSVQLIDFRADNLIVQREPCSGRLEIKVIDLAGAHIFTEEEEDQGLGCSDIELTGLALVARSLTGSWNILPEQKKLLTGRLQD